jgi:thiamin-phosphate kinase
MLTDRLKKALRFYFITDDSAPALTAFQQVKIAIQAGATLIQYRNKSFSSRFFEEVKAIKDFCKCNFIPFVINDNILLAKAVIADGVHLGQEDEDPKLARKILGSQAIMGKSVSNLDELDNIDLSHCDYIGTGPVFSTKTKADAKKVIGLSGLQIVAEASPVPVVAIGGIDSTNAKSCFKHGASGIAVISYIARADNPLANARLLASACGCSFRSDLNLPWDDEFNLIKKLLKNVPNELTSTKVLKIPPGDDACLLGSINNPVVTTDTQKEGIHFRFDWQTPEAIGKKAVEVAFSDLAASYALPVSLFINLTLPSYISDKTVEALYKGINQALTKHGCTLGGGNISAGTELSLDLFVIGRGRDDIFPTRSAALPGFGLYCTGHLGLARAGLDCLVKKDTKFQELIAKFKYPSARFDAAQILAKNHVTCVTDISDGLAGDARHIAEASEISIELDLKTYSFDPALVSFCKNYNQKPEEIVLAGGEDYELLFACLPDTFESVKKDLPNAFQVGRCLAFQGMHLVNTSFKVLSYQHGKKL